MVAPELFHHYPFFSFLKTAQLQALAGISREESYPAGTIVFREKEPAGWLYILVKGSIDLFYTVEVEYHPEQRKELFFGVINPGDFFGISALIEPHVLTSSARAAKASHVIKIDAAKLQALCDADEKLAYGLITQVAKATIERLNATRLQLATAWSTLQPARLE
ncbi:MAG: Crp/Fnr family transcriptional regulator [Omnitrophica WOR_2 bacterium]